jgi:hypothetical protein
MSRQGAREPLPLARRRRSRTAGEGRIQGVNVLRATSNRYSVKRAGLRLLGRIGRHSVGRTVAGNSSFVRWLDYWLSALPTKTNRAANQFQLQKLKPRTLNVRNCR